MAAWVARPAGSLVRTQEGATRLLYGFDLQSSAHGSGFCVIFVCITLSSSSCLL